MRVPTLLSIFALIAALALGVLFFPKVASAWFLNLANASLSRAQSLPLDSPERSLALARAVSDLEQAQQWSRQPRLTLLHARTALLRGDAKQALAAFESGSGPSDAMVHYTWGESAYQSGMTDVAFAHWRSAGAFELFIQEAHRAQNAREWPLAAKYARLAVGVYPSNADAHYVLGDALASRSGADDEAWLELDKALLLTTDPELKSTILSRQGELLVTQGKLDLALERFTEARRVAPIDARPRTNYAVTVLRVRPGDVQESTALLKQVVDDSPWYTAAFVALADISEQSGEAANAEKWLQAGLARNPNDPRLLVPLADFYVRQHRLSEARAVLVLALQSETHADALKEIAVKLQRLNAQ